MASRRSSGRSSRERARPTPEQLSERLGVVLDPETLSLALTHRSYAYENGRLPTNERLEFLGDSVLGFLVTSHLYEIHPERSEGDLAKMRASVVSTRALAAMARSISLGGHIRLGEGELRTGGQDKDSILADTMEALIGGTYLDHGLDAAHDLVHRLVAPMLDDERAMGLGTDWKTHIQEAASAGDLGEIEYRIEAQGPDHQKTFTATLVVGGKTYASGTGTSKKDAEREAAAASCDDVRADAGLSDSGQLPESDLP